MFFLSNTVAVAADVPGAKRLGTRSDEHARASTWSANTRAVYVLWWIRKRSGT